MQILQENDGKKWHIFWETFFVLSSWNSLRHVMQSLLSYFLWGRSQVSLFLTSVVNPRNDIFSPYTCLSKTLEKSVMTSLLPHFFWGRSHDSLFFGTVASPGNDIFSQKHVCLKLLKVSPPCFYFSKGEVTSLFFTSVTSIDKEYIYLTNMQYKPASSFTFFIVFCISSSTLFIDRLYWPTPYK